MAQTAQQRQAAQRANAKNVASGSLPKPMNRTGYTVNAASAKPFVSTAKPKVPALGSPHLSGPQFAKNAPRATPKPVNSSSMLPGGMGAAKPPVNRSPKPMYSAMHPGGGAAGVNKNAVTPQIPNPPITWGVKLSATPPPKQGFGSKIFGALLSAAQHRGGSVTQGVSPKRKKSELRPSKYAGQLANHLAGAAGA